MFEQGKSLIALMPPEVRPDIDLFIQGGLAILNAIEKQHYDVWQRRPKISKMKKAELLLRAAWKKMIPPAPLDSGENQD